MYNLDMEIVEAIEAMNMRAVVSHAEGQRRRSSQRRRIFQFATFIAAACVVLGVFFYNNASTALMGRGDECLQRYELPIIKGNIEIFNLIASSVDCIGSGLYDVSEQRLNKALELLGGNKPLTEQEESIARSIRDDIEWLKAITLMKQGKVFESRRALKAIASSNSYYSEEAKRAL